MKNNLHVMLSYSEAINLKRDILILEKEMLGALKYMKNYQEERKKEFTLKNKVRINLDQIHKLIKSIESELPKEELIEVIKESHKKVKPVVEKPQKIEKKSKHIVERKRHDIESQIDEIKAKLAALGASS